MRKRAATAVLILSVLTAWTACAQQNESESPGGSSVPGPVSPARPEQPEPPVSPVSPGEQAEPDGQEPSAGTPETAPEGSTGQEPVEEATDGTILPESESPDSESTAETPPESIELQEPPTEQEPQAGPDTPQEAEEPPSGPETGIADTLGAEPVPETPEPAPDTVQMPTLFRFSRFPDTSLVARPSQQLREIGELRDLVLTEAGRVSFYIAEIDNLQGFRSGLYILPSALVTVGAQRAMLELPAAQNAIVLIQDERLIRQYYPANSVLASRFVRFEVIGSDGRELGSVEDIVLDLDRGEVMYMALARSGFLGFGTQLYAVPFSGVRFDETREEISVNVSTDQIGEMGGFNKDFWPIRADPAWPGQSGDLTDQGDRDSPGAQSIPD